MDVQQWLENTADREPPDGDEPAAVGHCSQVPSKPEQASRKYRHKRKRASSDSSIIPPWHKVVRAEHQTHVPEGPRATEYTTALQHSLHGSQSCESAGRSPHKAHRTYERRTRHKTKPDRYDPNAKKQRKERKEREDLKSRPTRRRSHRSGNRTRTTGLVQTFQINNRPKNSRLTLKPDINAGIFKHGRASAQIAGRGSGLPDLVFNEMRFLQRPNNHQDELPKESDGPQTTKQGRKRHDNEEISAYFAKADPKATVATVHAPQIPEVSDDRLPQQTARRASRKDAVEPPVHLAENAILGFGSRGAAGESKATAPTNNSYFTWSESAVLPSRPKARNYSSGPFPAEAEVARADDGRDRALQDQQNVEPHARRHGLDEHFSSVLTKAETGAWLPSQNATGPIKVGAYEAKLQDQRHDRSRGLAAQRSRSKTQGTHHVSSEAPPASKNQTQSFNTSEILNISQPGHSRRHCSRRTRVIEQSGCSDSAAGDQENRDLESLSLTSKLLQQAQRAVIEVASADENGFRRRRPSGSTRSTRRYATDLRVFARNSPNASAGSNTQQKDFVRSPLLPQRRLQTASTLRTSRLLPRTQSTPHRQPSRFGGRLFSYSAPRDRASEEEEMLDDQPDARHIDWTICRPYANSRQVDRLVHGRPTSRAPGLYEVQTAHANTTRLTIPQGRNSYVPVSDPVWSQLSGIPQSARTPSPHGLSIERECVEDSGTGHMSGNHLVATDDFAGFWKPHILY